MLYTNLADGEYNISSVWSKVLAWYLRGHCVSCNMSVCSELLRRIHPLLAGTWHGFVDPNVKSFVLRRILPFEAVYSWDSDMLLQVTMQRTVPRLQIVTGHMFCIMLFLFGFTCYKWVYYANDMTIPFVVYCALGTVFVHHAWWKIWAWQASEILSLLRHTGTQIRFCLLVLFCWKASPSRWRRNLPVLNKWYFF